MKVDGLVSFKMDQFERSMKVDGLVSFKMEWRDAIRLYMRSQGWNAAPVVGAVSTCT